MDTLLFVIKILPWPILGAVLFRAGHSVATREYWLIMACVSAIALTASL